MYSVGMQALLSGTYLLLSSVGRTICSYSTINCFKSSTSTATIESPIPHPISSNYVYE